MQARELSNRVSKQEEQEVGNEQIHLQSGTIAIDGGFIAAIIYPLE